MGSMGSVGSCGFLWVLMFYCHSERSEESLGRCGDHVIVDGCAIPEILRFTQDDRGIAKRLASSRIEAERSAEIQKNTPPQA